MVPTIIWVLLPLFLYAIYTGVSVWRARRRVLRSIYRLACCRLRIS